MSAKRPAKKKRPASNHPSAETLEYYDASEAEKYFKALETDIKQCGVKLGELVKKLYTNYCKLAHPQIGWNADLKGTAECPLCLQLNRTVQATALEANILRAAEKVSDIDWAQDNAPDQAHEMFMEALKTPKSASLQDLTTLVQSILDAIHSTDVTHEITLSDIPERVKPFAHLGEKK